jgi:hypothetical protein
MDSILDARNGISLILVEISVIKSGLTVS